MQVCAVVINFNGADDLPGCLDSLLAQDVEVDVVVVDNASSDDSAPVLARYEREHGVRIVRNTTNRGYAGGANDGLAATTAPVVVFANPDTVLAPDYLRRAIARLQTDPRVGAVQGKLIRTVASPAGLPVIDTTGHLAFDTWLFRNRGEGEIDRGQYDEACEVFGVSGAVAVYRREMLVDLEVEVRDRRGRLLRTEVFDEDVFAFFEDVDLDWRAAMRGWSTWYEPAAVAHHERGGAGPRRTTFVEALNWRNRLLVLAKCAPGRPSSGFLVTLLLKTLELIITVPGAIPESARGLRLLPGQIRKRRTVHASAIVPSEAVVARWFEGFDYRAWVRTWWRRVRGIPVGQG